MSMHDMYKYRPCWSLFHVMDPAFVEAMSYSSAAAKSPFPFVGMDSNVVVVVVVANNSP